MDYKYITFNSENRTVLLPKDKVNAMSDTERYGYVHEVAEHYLTKAFGDSYDTSRIYIERQSVHEDDWYLYTLCAKKTKAGTFSVWTLNIESGGLAHGHYDLTSNGVSKAMCVKRGYYNE